jgi:hypothetical protein
MLPPANLFALANQNEKKHSLTLLEKTKNVLSRAGKKLRRVIVDTQYSDEKLRAAVQATAIPYPADQKRDVKGLLRVDEKFRTYGLRLRRKSIVGDLALKLRTVF